MPKSFNIYSEISRRGKQLLLTHTCALTHTLAWIHEVLLQKADIEYSRWETRFRTQETPWRSERTLIIKMSLCSWRNDGGSILKEADKDGETERQKETGEWLPRLISIPHTKQGNALYLVRQGNIIIFIACNSFKVSLVSLKAIPMDCAQTKEMCHRDPPLIFPGTNRKSFPGNYWRHSWQNQTFQRNQFPAQGENLTNAHEGPFPWKYVHVKLQWWKIVLN